MRAAPWLATVMVLAVALLGAQVLSQGGTAPASTEAPARPPAPATTIGQRPHLILIVVDDMRDDDLRFMPLTRRLMEGGGLRFLNSFSPYPSCCPARASLLTGLYTHNHHVEGIHEPYGFDAFDDRSTLATWLDEIGYRTVMLGKYLNGYGDAPVREPYGTTDSSLHYVPPGWDRWLASIDGGLPDSHPQAGGTYAYFNTTLSVDGERFRNFRRYQTRVYGRLSRRMIRRHADAPRPLFMKISYTAPHHGSPFEADDPPRYVRDPRGGLTPFETPARPPGLHRRLDLRIRSTPGLRWHDPDFSDKPGYLLAKPPLSRAERAAVLELAQQRAEAMWVLDGQVARTIEAIEAHLGDDPTTIIFTSDNGFFLGEQRMRSGKIYPHEPSLRVPFLIRGDGIRAGTTRTDPITSIDVAPTIAELAGVKPPTPVDGVSLVDVIRSGDRGWSRGIVTETGTTDLPGSPRRLLGLRTSRYLYVEVAYGGRELYDVLRDPQQYHNLAADPRYDRLQRRLARALDELKDCRGSGCARPLPAWLAEGRPRRR